MATQNGNSRRKRAASSRRVVVLAVPPVDEFDLVCPIQVFGAANRLAGKPVFSVEVVTNGKDVKVQGEGGVLSFVAETSYKALNQNFDSLLLVCGLGTRNTRDPALFAWLRRIAPSVRCLGSVCVGSFLSAEAGLLNGKRATSHWRFSKELARRYPMVKVESELVWVKDENIYTSAGISAGIDLALAWVEEDCGAAIAQEVARELVLFLRRSGGQKQLSVSLSAQASEMKAIQELQVWIADNLRYRLQIRRRAIREDARIVSRNTRRSRSASDSAPRRGDRSSTRDVIRVETKTVRSQIPVAFYQQTRSSHQHDGQGNFRCYSRLRVSRSRLLPLAPRPASRRESLRSRRDVRRAGVSPKAILARTEIAMEKAKTSLSTWMAFGRNDGMYGAIVIVALKASRARMNPVAPPMPPNSRLHSLASHLVAGNANLALIKQALGHRSINSTMQYVGTTDSQAADETARALMALY